MYLRLVQFNLGPGQRALAERVADRVVPGIRAHAGCERCEFFIDDEGGNYGFIVLWQSKETAAAAAEIFRPILQSLLGDALTVNHTVRLFDIYEPKQS
jgi:quinol monooxygenase YgiN